MKQGDNMIGKRVNVHFFGTCYEGVLVHFGIGFEELRDGIGHFTEAVILLDDGSVKTCPVTCITLIK